MTVAIPIDSQSPPTKTCPGRILAMLVGVMVLTLLLRLPFWAPAVTDMDALNYVMGALGYVVAQAPGYVGYCTLAMLLNKLLIGNVLHTYLLINLFFTCAAVLLVYPLSRRTGFSPRAAVLSAALFSLSFCLLTFSIRITTYVVEAMFSTLIAWLGLTAIQKRSRGWALSATAAWAVAGALRPSTTYLLAPLWIYIIFKSDRRWLTLALHLVIAAPLVLGWSRANSYFLAAERGFDFSSDDQPPGLEGQMLMPTWLDTDTLSIDARRQNRRILAYHWPAAEMLRWGEIKTGIELMPKTRPWPAPSLRRAGVRAGVNFLKMSFYLLLCAPLLLVTPAMWWMRKRLARPSAGSIGFYLFWIIPPMLFYIFGHFGVFGYLAIFLAAPYVLITGMLTDARMLHSPERKLGDRTRAALVLATAACVVVAGVWCFAKPIRTRSKFADMANLLVLCDVGHAATEHFTSGRSELAGIRNTVRDDYGDLRTDQQLLAQIRRENSFPNAKYKPNFSNGLGR